jgi:hypothetical protein
MFAHRLILTALLALLPALSFAKEHTALNDDAACNVPGS